MNIIYILAYIILWPVFRIIKPTRCINHRNIPKGGALYCANHTRMSDPLFVAYAMGWPHQIHVMAKEEVMHWPIIGWILRHGGIFGVKRGQADVAAVRTAMKYLKDGEKLLMFPEGTRVGEGEHVEAKTGAAMFATRTGAPLLPVYVPVQKRWFRPTTVVIGQPYHPQIAGRKGTAEEYHAIARELQQRIRELGEGRE